MRRSNQIQFKRFLCVLALLLVAASLLISGNPRPISKAAPRPIQSSINTKHVKKSGNKCTQCSPPGNQLIYIPLIDLPEARGGEIVFNSRSPEPMDVTPVFYRRNGETITGDSVRIQSAEIRYVNIRDLLPQRYRGEGNWGGFALSYYGANRQMWSQFRFLGVNGGGSVDEFFTVKDESKSAAYEAAWWMPKKSETIVALGNISDAATSASVRFGNGHTRTVNLQHATEIVREEYHEQGTESVKIVVTGAAGSIVPTGIITTKDGSFNSVIRFYDPISQDKVPS